MERHRCKLCFRTFANGRALGGHMKAHLTTLPLPPKPLQLVESHTESASSSSSSSGEEQEEDEQSLRDAEEKALAYGLRENPKKSFRLADPEFSFAVDAGSVVQDRESETELKNPTRQRSKRNRKQSVAENQGENLELKKPKLRKPSLVDSPEPLSSVSDTSPEEDVAMCLMMLSRGIWMGNNEEQDQEQGKQVQRSVQVKVQEPEELEEIKIRKVRGKHCCEKCKKRFRSYQALSSHKRICYRDEAGNDRNERIFECPFCDKVFGSGQALGGHKRSHLLGSSTAAAATANAAAAAASPLKLESTVIDLNLPAPVEEDDFSVVSDA
ncbi:zinc finger protein ZAT4-like [Juglans microcarpa x Juglans regia]|uniref:zinc finger protein ZAT4-like n=1 Tax=Juglans microcarpa x Juglans regia TaxID=2249226 RepID=UPI001B7E55A0|nr:zinc finger protein ZAT4-like [Juglans microcarpa x Juglans regia]